MPQLIWMPEALRVSDAVIAFLRQGTRKRHPAPCARSEGMRIVEAHPKVGRPADRMDPAFREWLIPFGDSGYVALYRLDGDLAVVLAVSRQREAG